MDNSQKITLREILEKIKQKPELQGIDNSIVSSAIEKYLKKNSIPIKILDNFREKEIKILVKDVRAQLHFISGQFFEISEKERADNYTKVKEILSSLNVKSILDIGCGLNPLFLASNYIEYNAIDINTSYIDKINSFFKKKGIKGKAFFYDLREIKPMSLPDVDVCVALKVFDVIEKRGHKLAEKIIKNTRCRYFLISFPTKTLSGKPMTHPQRGWIERLLQRLGFSFQFFKTKDEVFYLAEKV
ncbi:hypothetical protein HYW75_01435 [Candidatus Pacearchaeota archaeon]|nr:hypothetical protein [Candidatus Pacearchaeota archaeon]